MLLLLLCSSPSPWAIDLRSGPSPSWGIPHLSKDSTDSRESVETFLLAEPLLDQIYPTCPITLRGWNHLQHRRSTLSLFLLAEGTSPFSSYSGQDDAVLQ